MGGRRMPPISFDIMPKNECIYFRITAREKPAPFRHLMNRIDTAFDDQARSHDALVELEFLMPPTKHSIIRLPPTAFDMSDQATASLAADAFTCLYRPSRIAQLSAHMRPLRRSDGTRRHHAFVSISRGLAP